MGATIRRLENNLNTLGAGVIAFGFWAFIKFALSYLMMGSGIWEDIEEEIQTAVIITAWIISALSALVYLWLGLSARAEGKGKRKRIFYLIVIGVIITFSALVIVAEILALVTLSDSLGKIIITLIIDATRMVFLIELLASSIKLRVLRKEQLKKEANAE